MDIVTILILLIGIVVILFFINHKFSQTSQNQKTSPELLEYLKTTHVRLNESARVISDVQKNLGEMSEIGRSMRDLQEFLKSPKLRGNMGEHVLNELLVQMLPKQAFHLQYAFRSGEKVDAAIQTSAGIVPIDSKFPMESFRRMMDNPTSPDRLRGTSDFNRDVKKHVDDIARKYINTAEGTIDYALMYIPSEAVYYEIVNSHTLFEYASKKRILPVSPTTFYAFMKAILMSFEGQKVEAQAKQILSALRAIQNDYTKIEENLNTLQKHLNNAFNMMGNVYTSFTQLGQKISSMKRLED